MMVLTWPGFDAAIDLIAAQCTHRDRSGVYGASPAGLVMAVALADRLSLPLLPLPTPGMVLVDGVIARCSLLPELVAGLEDVDAWFWVDASEDQEWNSVIKMAGACQPIAFPWQDAPACRPVPFMAGFHD
jgi:hypothetical protein